MEVHSESFYYVQSSGTPATAHGETYVLIAQEFSSHEELQTCDNLWTRTTVGQERLLNYGIYTDTFIDINPDCQNRFFNLDSEYIHALSYTYILQKYRRS